MFTGLEGIYLITAFCLAYGLLMCGISWAGSQGILKDKLGFLLADRNLGFFESSFSVAATWIWAPAIFISAQKAFVNGWIGAFWFTVPNILCLILFAYFANNIRKQFPAGFTLSEYMKEKYSPRIQSTYWVTLVGLTVCAFSVQLLAGAALMETLMGIPYFWGTVIMSAIPLSYSMIFGLKSSVVTDYVKIILMLAIGAVLIPMVISNIGGLPAVIAGLGGSNGAYISFFSENSWNLFLSFGLPITIGLISGPFGDQSFWQRAFATRKDVVKKSFILAAFIFAIVPLMMSALGFAAAGAGLAISNVQMVNVETVQAALGATGVIFLFLFIMAGLTSILDSKMAAISSIAGHDIADRFNLDFLKSSRSSMIILTILAIAIANIPGLKILHLFLFYGTLRSATLLPTILTLKGVTLNEQYLFVGIMLAILVGLPIFAYGNINGMALVSVTGTLLTLLLPLISLRKA